MRPEDVLPDSIDHVTIDGQLLRKGTVAAFLASARVWLDPSAEAAQRKQVEEDMTAQLPALRALRLFDILEVRNTTLRTWLENR